MVQINITKADGVDIPSYATLYSSGLDLQANITQPIILQPLERVIIPTGISIELPIGYEAQVRPRSGLAAKYGIMAHFGTIDSDYRGEIGVILINMSKDEFEVKPLMRIAQLVIAKYEYADLNLVLELSNTTRSSNGFGSTGL
jgi:dUTP pyrophosphatase